VPRWSANWRPRQQKPPDLCPRRVEIAEQPDKRGYNPAPLRPVELIDYGRRINEHPRIVEKKLIEVSMRSRAVDLQQRSSLDRGGAATTELAQQLHKAGKCISPRRCTLWRSRRVCALAMAGSR
jgi:hypothetical protein